MNASILVEFCEHYGDYGLELCDALQRATTTAQLDAVLHAARTGGYCDYHCAWSVCETNHAAFVACCPCPCGSSVGYSRKIDCGASATPVHCGEPTFCAACRLRAAAAPTSAATTSAWVRLGDGVKIKKR